MKASIRTSLFMVFGAKLPVQLDTGIRKRVAESALPSTLSQRVALFPSLGAPLSELRRCLYEGRSLPSPFSPSMTPLSGFVRESGLEGMRLDFSQQRAQPSELGLTGTPQPRARGQRSGPGSRDRWESARAPAPAELPAEKKTLQPRIPETRGSLRWSPSRNSP